MIKVEKKLIYFIFALIIIDLIIISFMNRKSICLQSDVIQQAEWHFKESDPTFSVYSCSSNKKVIYNESIIDDLQNMNRLIYKIENHLKDMGNNVHGFKIHILTQSKNTLQISGDELFISNDLLHMDMDDHFYQGLIKSWVLLQQKKNGLDLFRLEVLSQFLFQVFEIQSSDEDQQRWTEASYSTKGRSTSLSAWCKSPLKQMDYESLCLDFNTAKEAPGFSHIPSALWFAHQLYLAYKQSPIEERLAILKRFDESIQKLSERLPEHKGISSLSELTSFLKSESIIWGDVFADLKFIHFKDNFLKSIEVENTKFLEQWTKLDFIFLQNKSWSMTQIRTFQNLALVEQKHFFIGLNNEGYWLWPFIGGLKVSALDQPIKANFVIYQSCIPPKVFELQKMSQWTNRVLWILDCDLKDNHVALNGFLHRGLQYFSLDNSKVEFVLFYLPALDFLIKKDPKIANGAFALKSMRGQQNHLAEIAGWSPPLWKAETRAYEVSSAIGVVEWFKFSNDMWPEIVN